MKLVSPTVALLVALLLGGCATPSPEQQADSVQTRGGEANYKVVRVNYATDRQPTGSRQPAEWFGGVLVAAALPPKKALEARSIEIEQSLEAALGGCPAGTKQTQIVFSTHSYDRRCGQGAAAGASSQTAPFH